MTLGIDTKVRSREQLSFRRMSYLWRVTLDLGGPWGGSLPANLPELFLSVHSFPTPQQTRRLMPLFGPQSLETKKKVKGRTNI